MVVSNDLMPAWTPGTQREWGPTTENQTCREGDDFCFTMFRFSDMSENMSEGAEVPNRVPINGRTWHGRGIRKVTGVGNSNRDSTGDPAPQ